MAPGFNHSNDDPPADDDADDDAHGSVHVEEGVARSKLLRGCWYNIDLHPEEELELYPGTCLPMVLLPHEDGPAQKCFLLRVCLPPKDRLYSSPRGRVLPSGGEEETRMQDDWKLPDGLPYWVTVRGKGTPEQDLHVLDIEFPGGCIPFITQLTRGTPLKNVSETGDQMDLTIKRVRRLTKYLKAQLTWVFFGEGREEC